MSSQAVSKDSWGWGFSLIELLIVIAIFSLIGLMSVAFYSRFVTQNAVANTADQLVNMLRKAQIYSITGKSGGGTWGVKYTASPNRITLYLTSNPAFDENFSVNGNIVITGLSTPVTFAHFTGLPSSAPTVTLTGNENTDTVTINSQGVASKN